MLTYTRHLFFFLLCSLWLTPAAWAIATSHHPTQEETRPTLNYIAASWKELTRSMHECKSLVDPKTHQNFLLYFPKDFPIPAAVQKLKTHCSLIIKRLPQKINRLGQVDVKNIYPDGLLYLPNPYVIPGGMFNEMYGWDSYFIIRGLIKAKKLELARGMVENFFFEIDHYGAILNANRTYYLSRSQPPFLTSMIRAVYQSALPDLPWLAKAYHYARKDYQLWTVKPHRFNHATLARYYDFSHGPVPELDDSAQDYYAKILQYFKTHPKIGKTYLSPSKNPPFTVSLNHNFYKSDRAMRESGFDTSNRFGIFSAATTDFAPVELNSLLYKAEKDLAWIALTLKKTNEAKYWEKKAALRLRHINQYFWNEAQGFYFDYNFKQKRQSTYIYATSFYPLWTGAASRHQAKKVAANLHHFERQGGIVSSPYNTGAQWDSPYGWAPLQLITIEGLNRYGFKDLAHRLSRKYIHMIVKNFNHDKTIHEKYDVESQTAKTHVQVGYKVNVIGFGWTNGVFLVLLNDYLQ
ncbi:MAG: trehalase [Gammaproteobacteria bacterium]|nr:trehalase [Gammaproteobacteria bacterium]